MHIEGWDETVPDFVGTRNHVLQQLIGFSRTLRAVGVDVPVNAGIVAARALIEVGFDDQDRVRVALRAALISRQEDLATFDRLFPEFWQRLTAGPRAIEEQYEQGSSMGGLSMVDASSTGIESLGTASDESAESEETRIERLTRRRVAMDESGEQAGEDGAADEATTAVYSPTGRSKQITVESSALGPRDDQLERALHRLTDVIAGLRGRRWSRPGEERIDTRRALRRSFGTGGTVLSVPHQQRKRSAIRAFMLVDVSQSVLDTIDRGFLIRFLRAAHGEWRSVRIFFFDTSVREVTDQFDAATPSDAITALERAEAEWGGGTRIGHAIEAIRRKQPDAIDRETIVFVISDGLEVGEIDVLEAGMSWLSRRSGAVVWLNPLAGSPAYEPTCRGMEASLPYIQGLFAFTDASDLTEMARQIEQQGLRGPIGYEYDPRRPLSAGYSE